MCRNVLQLSGMSGLSPAHSVPWSVCPSISNPLALLAFWALSYLAEHAACPTGTCPLSHLLLPPAHATCPTCTCPLSHVHISHMPPACPIFSWRANVHAAGLGNNAAFRKTGRGQRSFPTPQIHVTAALESAERTLSSPAFIPLAPSNTGSTVRSVECSFPQVSAALCPHRHDALHRHASPLPLQPSPSFQASPPAFHSSTPLPAWVSATAMRTAHEVQQSGPACSSRR